MFNLLSIAFGGAFTLATAFGMGAIVWRKSPAPPEILLATGAAAESALVFLLLLCHAAVWPVFLAMGACTLAGLWWMRGGNADYLRKNIGDLRKNTDDKRRSSVPLVIFVGYGIFYLASALAPEIQPDAITYHLGLPFEYVRLGAFPDHVRFYDVVPQGMEMLFTVAFAFGRHAAAKLVELGLFAAGVPLIFRLGRRLGIGDTGSLAVAVFYLTAPVLGLTGSSAYNDAALAFFALAAFYLLLEWRARGESWYLGMAGAMAGFCYAIKFPGAFVAIAAVLFVAADKPRHWKPVAVLAAGIACTAGPWMLRSELLTGNPVAPLGNQLFPNPDFNIRTDRGLAEGMRSLHGIPPARVPWELALGDGLSGTFGPMLLLLPLGLAACRTREGRWCVAGAVILAIPWWSNTGARFLIPAAVVGAFALAMVLPRKAAWAAIALQAVACWPTLLNTWQPPYTFRLHEFPWRAALGLESEPHYLRDHLPEYDVAGMVKYFTAPDDRIFSLIPVAGAYLPRDVSVSWQSAEGDRLVDTLRMAAKSREDPLFDWTAEWPLASLRAVRFRMPRGSGSEWDLAEVRLFSGGDRVFNSPLWTLRAWPNVWEAPLAFDSRFSTVWRTWQPTRAGMFLEVDLDHPQNLSAAVLASHAGAHGAPVEFYGQAVGGEWRLLSNRPSLVERPAEDLRLEAAATVRRAGYKFLLAPVGGEGNGDLGRKLMAEAPQWGLGLVGQAGPNVLFRVR